MSPGLVARKAPSLTSRRRSPRRWHGAIGKASVTALALVALAGWHSVVGTLFAAPNSQKVVGEVDKVEAELARVRAAPDPELEFGRKFYAQGQALNGIVKRVLNSGIIITIKPGVDGFAHVSKLRDGYVGHPGEVVDEGDKVTCRVVSHDSQRLELTLREAGDKDLMDFKVGQQLDGTVVAVCNAGADVNIGATKYAFLHKSQIKDGQAVMDAREYLQKGDKVKAWVKRKDVRKKSLLLTMVESQLERKSIATGLKIEKLSPGDELGGEVGGIAPFGIFVSVGAESDGLVHVRRINQGMVDLPQLFQRGDRLLVRVFDIRDGKLELELVDVPPRLPRVDSFEPLQGETVDAEVIRKIPKAFLVSVAPPSGGEAVLAKLSSGPWTDLAEGEVTKVKINRVDVTKRQLSISDPFAPDEWPTESESEPSAPSETAAQPGRSYSNL